METLERAHAAWVPEPGAMHYPLELLVHRPAARRSERHKGIALGAEHLYWNAGVDAARSYGQVSRISLSLYDKVEGDGGSCRVAFADGLCLTIISGVHAGANAGEREAVYDDFLHHLHACLSPADRHRIVFQDGMPIPNSSIVIGGSAVAAVGFVPGAIAALVGDTRFVAALVFGVVAGGVTALGMLFAQGRVAERRYDPASLPAHALAGQGRLR